MKSAHSLISTPLLFKQNEKPVKDYKRAVRSSVYGVWSGSLDVFEFIDSMISAMSRSYRRAWVEGAKECGIAENELTAEELQALQEEVNQDIPYLLDFARNIAENSRENGQKFTPHMRRANLWVNRYISVRNHAKSLACKNKKMKWVRSVLKDSCIDCIRLDGKVKRQSTWLEYEQQYGVRPQSHALACGGWLCGCSFVQTDEPLTRGRLPVPVGPER